MKGRDQVPQLVDRYLAGDIDVDPLISHTLTLDEATAASTSCTRRTGSAPSFRRLIPAPSGAPFGAVEPREDAEVVVRAGRSGRLVAALTLGATPASGDTGPPVLTVWRSRRGRLAREPAGDQPRQLEHRRNLHVRVDALWCASGGLHCDPRRGRGDVRRRRRGRGPRSRGPCDGHQRCGFGGRALKRPRPCDGPAAGTEAQAVDQGHEESRRRVYEAADQSTLAGHIRHPVAALLSRGEGVRPDRGQADALRQRLACGCHVGTQWDYDLTAKDVGHRLRGAMPGTAPDTPGASKVRASSRGNRHVLQRRLFVMSGRDVMPTSYPSGRRPAAAGCGRLSKPSSRYTVQPPYAPVCSRRAALRSAGRRSPTGDARRRRLLLCDAGLVLLPRRACADGSRAVDHDAPDPRFEGTLAAKLGARSIAREPRTSHRTIEEPGLFSRVNPGRADRTGSGSFGDQRRSLVQIS